MNMTAAQVLVLVMSIAPRPEEEPIANAGRAQDFINAVNNRS
jgi:hypothetical protein